MSNASKLITKWNLAFIKDYALPFHTSMTYGKIWTFSDLIKISIIIISTIINPSLKQ